MSPWDVVTLTLAAAGLLIAVFLAGMIVGQRTMMRDVQERLRQYGLELTHDPRRR